MWKPNWKQVSTCGTEDRQVRMLDKQIGIRQVLKRKCSSINQVYFNKFEIWFVESAKPYFKFIKMC